MHLGSIVHVSDLHIGRLGAVSGDADARRLWAYSRAFHGLIGHEYRALVLIERFVRTFDRTEEPRLLKLVVSGDLTRVGHPDEFSLAVNYRDRFADFGDGRRLGLGRAGAEVSIPGNHDHWPGRSAVWGGPTPAFARAFPGSKRPYWDELTPLRHGFMLRFIGIDTDADVSPWGANRFLARGEFLTQLQVVAHNLPPIERREIRVLVMHHSPACRSLVLGIQKASREALADFIEDQSIGVILTGHTHSPRARVDSFHFSRAPVSRLEARCGTSSVRRNLPYDWRKFLRRPVGRSDENTLLLHELALEDDEVVWTARTHLQVASGFVPVDLAKVPDAAAMFRVWPL